MARARPSKRAALPVVYTRGVSRGNHQTRRSPRRARVLRIAVAALLACLAASAIAFSAAPSPAFALQKGIIEPLLEQAPTPAARAALIDEIGAQLHVSWVRVAVNWSRLEPTPGLYDPAEVARLDALVDGLHDAGIKVMLTTCSVPAWASQSSWWTHPPASYAAGYQPFYPMRTTALPDYGRLGQYLAAHFAGRVQALECWNEPNLWPYIYPQRTSGDEFFAARTYLRMLKAFHAGVSRAHTRVLIVGGATAPIGLDDRMRTSPQKFARFLARNHAGRYFDAYSHHPYTPGGSFLHRPDQPPNDPTNTVTLYNLRTLLRLFPAKPFYLTEYGYGTQPSAVLGLAVSPSEQAAYLRQAFARARKYRQVKALFWCLLYDVRPPGAPADQGIYTGLREADGTPKPAWYAFRDLRR